MEFLNKNRLYIGVIVLALAGLWLYMTYFSGPSSSATLSNDRAASPLSQDVLITLSNLNTIRLDESIFSDPLFMSLSDYGVAIPPQNAGRRNPFLPL